MCLFTHFAAGALAGGATGNVWVGAAAGLASHAVLDAIPHYDHPDWRVELTGGLASLVLLLLLPFASAPAVVGGIMGMVPDLENLFQKLGWMGRNRFVFPSHTGLVPHGRELGPRTLVWQAAIFVACFALLGLVDPPAAAAADAPASARLGKPTVAVLGAGEGTTVVRVALPVLHAPDDWRQTDPRRAIWPVAGWTGEQGREDEPPTFPVSLAVPTRGEVGVRVVDVRWWREPDDAAAVATMVRIGRPAVRRGVPIVGAAVVLAPGGGILRDVTLEFTHPASGPERENLRRTAAGDPRTGRLDEPIPPGLLNPDLHARLRRGELARAASVRPHAAKAAPGELFAATTHWVKLDVPATGLYRVTGAELAEYGVPTGDVDPTKLRLYRGGGLHLEENPEVPDSLQANRIGLNEVGIEVVDGGDGEWNLDDELRFYGVATSTWLDRFDPAAGRLDHYDHPFCATAVYWLTWEGDAVPSPLPGAPRRVAVAAAPALGAPVVAAGQVRQHWEEQLLDERGLVADGFVWTNNITSSRSEDFTLRNPVAAAEGAQARFAVDIRAAAFDAAIAYEAQAWLNADQDGMGVAAFTSRTQQDSLRVRVLGTSSAVADGRNSLTVRNGVTGDGQRLALDAFAVMAPCALDLRDGDGALEFGLWGDEVAEATPADLRIAASTPSALLLWDVTVPDSAVVHAGTAGAADVTYGLLREPGVDRHFVAAQATDLQPVAGGRRVRPVDLREGSGALDYVVVAPAVFGDAAGDLAAFRATSIPGIAAPAAAAVLVEDIYDNFAGGQKDLRAIRNYLKWLYAQGGQRLRYACFLGNASRDPRNWKNKPPLLDLVDWVPTEIRTRFPDNPYHESRYSPYASDDGLVSFDAAAPGDVDLPDLASARIAALDQTEARDMVDRVIAYARAPEPGAWRNHVVFVADDANRPGFELPITGIEPRHTAQAEKLVESFLPPALDVRKIFAVDYPFPPGSGIKPQVRQTINAALNAGTTMYYYVGHGAEDNLADEQIFRSQDIAGLTNDQRRFVFLAFSCDVGVFDSIVRRSMAEQFVAAEKGGAIAAICASQVSYVSDNELLSEKFYEALYPDRSVDPRLTLGEALAGAKGAMGYAGVRANSQRYTLFGDPATRLPNPDDDLAFAPGSVDTLRAGQRHVAVVASGGGAALLGAGDGYDLNVGDSAYETTFVAYNYTYDEDRRPVFDLENPLYFRWIKAGSPVFRGTGTMGGADLRVPFKAPLQLGTGERGRVRLILGGPDGDHTAVRTVPVVTGATGPVDDIRGPLIRLNPAEKAVRVPPRARFEATFFDTSGIAMLGTNAGNSILLEFDDSGFMTNVTGSFAYDPDSYVSGSMAFTLPADLVPGSHTAALYAADALGNVGSDTLAFELSVEGAADIRSVTVFPNPTDGQCRLVFWLTDPMEVRWDIYTVAGRRVRSIPARFGAVGAQFIEWDGRDGEGDELANGTYLYVVRGLAVGADGRDINRTGKLVIMR